jgi:hypothetical protein
MGKVISRDFSKTPEISGNPMDWICPIKLLRHNKLKEKPFFGETYPWKDEKANGRFYIRYFQVPERCVDRAEKRRSRKEL